MVRTGAAGGSEKQLREALGRLGVDVVEALSDTGLPTAVIDANGIIRWISDDARKIFGEGAVGRSWFSFIDEHDVRAMREEHARVTMGSSTPRVLTVTVVAQNGKRLRGEVVGLQLRRDHRVVGIFGTGRLRPVALRRERLTAQLTPRQSQVLRLLAAGESTEQIASELGIAVDTTRNHIRALLRRLGVHSRLEAVARAHRTGLLD